ncbi:hypothetical protein TNCV_433571 [Trichonephila clavipes]|nr:hypothetical protein TNCV_433571 [Trichonephila clavipes]
MAEAVREAAYKNGWKKKDLLLLLMVAGRSVALLSKTACGQSQSVDTGKVIDVVPNTVFVRTKKHLQNCKRNLKATAVRWEKAAGALSIFQFPVSLQCSGRANKIFRDGDSKAFTLLSRTKHMVTIVCQRN